MNKICINKKYNNAPNTNVIKIYNLVHKLMEKRQIYQKVAFLVYENG